MPSKPITGPTKMELAFVRGHSGGTVCRGQAEYREDTELLGYRSPLQKVTVCPHARWSN